MEDLSWVPERAVFLRRTFGIGIATFLFLLALGMGLSFYFELSYLWTLPTALLLSLGFVFDDVLRWRARKFESWQINAGHLTHEGQEGSATIPLTDISNVKTGIGSRVVISLTSGKRIEMRFLPYPIQTAQQIEAAKQAVMGA